jgi:membrane associated rhomboid family serine protease
MSDAHAPEPERQPVFNLPDVVIFLIAILVGIEVVRDSLLSPSVDKEILFLFAFIPARITELSGVLPGGEGAAVWSFLSYGLLHGNWSHVAVNCLGLAAFGSPLARRFGAARFLLFSAVGTIAGALVFLALHADDITALIGASAAISAQMAGASRFVFSSGGPLRGGGPGLEAYRRPAQPLTALLQDSRIVMFVAVWFGVNFVFGLLGPDGNFAAGPVAWEAHIGGFVAGLLIFPLFDPIAVASPIDRA